MIPEFEEKITIRLPGEEYKGVENFVLKGKKFTSKSSFIRFAIKDALQRSESLESAVQNRLRKPIAGLNAEEFEKITIDLWRESQKDAEKERSQNIIEIYNKLYVFVKPAAVEFDDSASVAYKVLYIHDNNRYFALGESLELVIIKRTVKAVPENNFCTSVLYTIEPLKPSDKGLTQAEIEQKVAAYLRGDYL